MYEETNAADVTSDDAAGQTEHGVVCTRNKLDMSCSWQGLGPRHATHLLLRLELDDGHDGSKDLLLRDGHFVLA